MNANATITRADFDMLARYIANAWRVSIVAGAAGMESEKRRSWRQFRKLEKLATAAGWRIDTGATATLVDPSGVFA